VVDVYNRAAILKEPTVSSLPLAKLVVGVESAAAHLLFVLPAAKTLPADLPERGRWLSVLKRRAMKAGELAKTPLAIDFEDGGRAACVMVDGKLSRFERLSVLRKATMLLLDESPADLAIVPVAVDDATVADAVYVALVNGVPLPARKKKPAKPLQTLAVVSAQIAAADLAPVRAIAEANVLARELTALAPNELTPATYRKRIRALAKRQGWRVEEYDFARLRKMGAGAFCAVAQGSAHQDAAIVRLRYRPKNAARQVALVGKGICFDTGGHNLKPARYMAGMHEDMAGSAVALAILQAAQALQLPVAIDVWLAIAHNHLSPAAYAQGDIVTTLDGTSIEVVHTDAEGRMVLADTLIPGRAGAARPDRRLRYLDRQHGHCARYAPERRFCQRRTPGGAGRGSGLGVRRAGVRVSLAGGLRCRPRVEGGRRQAMHSRRRGRPHPGGALPQALCRRSAVAACRSVGGLSRGGARRRGVASDGFWRRLGS
jgi:leucyl aminopeptidase